MIPSPSAPARSPGPCPSAGQAGAALALFAALLGGCWNHVGVACADGDPLCEDFDLRPGPDLAIPDLAAPDLVPPPDLILPPDLVPCQRSCAAGCCDAQGRCHPIASTASCGSAGGLCAVCDPASADTCRGGMCVCGSGGPCAAGQRCQGGACVCDAASCPTGCCDGTTKRCTPRDVSNCAAPGGVCAACPLNLADGCGALGCACGNGPACVPGQRCQAGACVCDDKSCPGCCSLQATCVKPSVTDCAPAGKTCAPCDATVADSCVNGKCSCGGGDPCGAGQQCLGGACQCTALACPNGCCDPNQKCQVPSPQQCAVGGRACQLCDGQLADFCLNGACSCGMSGAPCIAGQRCKGGACVCDNASCSNGCCSGAVCTPWSVATCGGPGASCAPCDGTADGCVKGKCTCGGSPACVNGQQCDQAKCVCNAKSCPMGCCQNGACTPPSNQSCGAPGQPCVACGVGATCVNNACVLPICILNQVICAQNLPAKCVGSCNKDCPGSAALCPGINVCVATCADCPGFGFSCDPGNNVFPTCIANCNKCQGKCQ